MPARSPFRFLHRMLTLAGPLAWAGCAAATAGGAAAPVPSTSSLITQETIAASGAKTAWDALQRTVPYVRLRESKGRPARMTRRGPASIYLDDQVRLMLDNAQVPDVQVLDQIPASDIVTIEVLSGLDATTRYGGTSTAGVIIIHTKTGTR
jgi:outer membrane receptor for ferrienterochelin and colicin